MTQSKQQTLELKQKRLWSHITAFFSRISKRQYELIGFYILAILALIHLGIMTLHLLDSNYNFPILKHSYISAVYPDQNVNDTMHTSIVRITPFDENEITIGDQVIIYNDFNVEEYWVETVVDILPDTNQVELSYDQVTSITTRYDTIIGVYETEANLIGRMYYTSKFTTGYLLMVVFHGFILAGYYIGIVDKKE